MSELGVRCVFWMKAWSRTMRLRLTQNRTGAIRPRASALYSRHVAMTGLLKSKSYSPGDDADEIIARQVANRNYPSADAVVKAGVRMLEEFEADIARLRSRIDEADAAYQRGEFRKSPGAEAMKADIISRGEARLRRKS